ncbi:MAG: DUF192 domain-containing protein, partial [Thermaurantiacus sp.]
MLPRLEKARTAALAIAIAASVAPLPAVAQQDPFAGLRAFAAGEPNRGLKVVPLAIETGDGRTHRYRIEVAETPAQQEKGMMFRTEMAADSGMLFPMRPARPAAFWMRNTFVSLDII